MPRVPKESLETQEVKEVKLDTTNPFNIGVTYDMFLENVNGKTTVDSLLKKHKLNEEQINWIKQELKNYKKK